MGRNNRELQVRQANATANRLWMVHKAFIYRDILGLILEENLNPEGISPARFAAMISHIINNGD